MEIVRTSHVVYNRRADKPVEMGIDLYLQVEKGTKVNWNTQMGWESGGEIGGTIGGGMEWDIGLPEMIWAKVNGKLDVSGKWVGKKVDMNFNGGEDSEIVRVSPPPPLPTRHDIALTELDYEQGDHQHCSRSRQGSFMPSSCHPKQGQHPIPRHGKYGSLPN